MPFRQSGNFRPNLDQPMPGCDTEVTSAFSSIRRFAWLGERTSALHLLVEQVCREHLTKLQKAAEQSIQA
jgi:hypothetical protein